MPMNESYVGTWRSYSRTRTRNTHYDRIGPSKWLLRINHQTNTEIYESSRAKGRPCPPQFFQLTKKKKNNPKIMTVITIDAVNAIWRYVNNTQYLCIFIKYTKFRSAFGMAIYIVTRWKSQAHPLHSLTRQARHHHLQWAQPRRIINIWHYMTTSTICVYNITMRTLHSE